MRNVPFQPMAGGMTGMLPQPMVSMMQVECFMPRRGTTLWEIDEMMRTAMASMTFYNPPVSRSLSLATAYQASTPGQSASVTVNLTSSASFSILGGQTNTADIVIGATNAVAGGTGSVVGKYANSSTATVAVGVGVASVMSIPITFDLPANWYFAIRQTAGTVSIVSAFDQVIG